MGTLLTFLLPALAPAITDGVRGLVARFTGGAGSQPANIAERVQLMQAETARLQALATLDAPVGSPSQWVVDMRASYRYIAIGVIWALAGLAALADLDRVGPGLGEGAAQVLVTRSAPQVVEVAVGDAGQALVTRVAEPVPGALAELAGGRSRQGVMEAVDFGQQRTSSAV